MNSYEWILNKVKASINESQRTNRVLLDEDIQSAIKGVRAMSDLVNSDNLPDAAKQQFLNGYNYQEITDADWSRIDREVKSIYSATLPIGVGIVSDNAKRNTSWWSDEYQYKKDNFYWGRYKAFLEKKLGIEVVRTTDRDTNFILNNIGNPADDEFSTYGMVVGHVQSGKTANFSGVLCKAADAGYKFIVVISGDKTNLRNQTQIRVDESFTGYSGERKVGVGIDSDDNQRRPVSLTHTQQDFNIDKGRSFSGIQSGAFKNPVILVVKKNGSILENLLTWLKEDRRMFSDVPMLVIDDESDYASINTKEEEDPTSINAKIRELLTLSRRSSYVAYTATPFANIFIDHQIQHSELGKDLFPKDFIYALSAPTNYFGSEEFLMNGNEQLYWSEIDDHKDLIPIKHKKDDDLVELPESLYEAIRCFMLSVVIRSLRGQEDQHKSMLIHISRFTLKHSEVADLVGEYRQDVLEDIKAYSMLDVTSSVHMTDLKNTFEKEFQNKIEDYVDFNSDSEFELEFGWSEVKRNLLKFVESIKVKEEHQESISRLDYDDSDPINVIAIGGLSLSRGFTVEGLTVSYFLRGTLFYDTLMQMARWYGYRTGYKDLCRVYMTEKMLDNYQHIHESTIELIERLKEMNSQNRTPEDFGLAVVEHPDNVLKVTAVKKMSNAESKYVSMRLDGSLKETARLSLDQEIFKKNFFTIEKIVSELVSNYKLEDSASSSHLWRNVSQDLICSFLRDFKVFDDGGFGSKSRMPIIFVREFANENQNWDVALYSGEGEGIDISGVKIKKEKRKIRIGDDEYLEFNSRNISSGTAEAISLPKDLSKEARNSIKGKREQVRSCPNRNNLLMLHIAQRSDESDYQMIPCFGVSFSGDGASREKTTRVLMNQVMRNETKEAIEFNKEIEE